MAGKRSLKIFTVADFDTKTACLSENVKIK